MLSINENRPCILILLIGIEGRFFVQFHHMPRPENKRPVENQALARVRKDWERQGPVSLAIIDLVSSFNIVDQIAVRYDQMRVQQKSLDRFHVEGFYTPDQISQLIKAIREKHQIYNVYFSQLEVDGKPVTQITIHRN